MDFQLWWMIFKIIISLGFVLCLIYVSAKYGGSKLQSIQNGRYVKVIERTQLSKENSLLVVKIGSRAYVISSTNSKIEIVCELSNTEISEIENVKSIYEYRDLKDLYNKIGLKNILKKTNENFLIKKLRFKKEDKDEV
ncbi:flagellar biosynthetic protein FliO [Clostridium sp. WILCCON 0269]|uniref:Flagellar biosynthetic protein FliO n=1 Tax=Candidatus Clostridium eludens TaxID=3381663 RepID=A0ABW8SJF9_9CLOT